MRYVFGFLCLICALPAYPQGYNITHAIEGDSLVYYAYNHNYCPYHITLQARVDSTNWGSPHFFILPAQTKSTRIVAYPKPTRAQAVIDYEVSAYFGNPTLKPDTAFVYTLPYAPKERYRIMQGYNGRFSHKNQYALDFKMPIGTPIHAARGGVVIRVKQDSDKHGRSQAFAEFGNYIIIYHEDGTMAYYFHISKDGSKVKVGEQVRQGQFIALSGNTGWSTAPHLHFVVKHAVKNGYTTIPTWFCTEKKPRKRLKAWKRYRPCLPK